MTTETDTERAARVHESWFVTNPDCTDIVLLATSPRANYQYLCSCGHHGTIASLNLAYAREVCVTHLRTKHVDVTPADPFEGLA